MTALRQYLEQGTSLEPQALQTALRRQQIYGGSLDTVLLELELCSPDELERLLTDATGHPAAPVELLTPQAHRPWDRLPTDLLEMGWASPLALREGRLAVAFHPDLPPDKYQRLRALGDIELLVTPECIMATLAAERSGSVIPQRYAVLSARFLREKTSEPGRVTAPQGSGELTRTGPPPGAHIVTDPSFDQGAPQDLERLLAKHVSALERARERDAVTDALVAAASVLTRRVALFGVKKEGLVALESSGTDLSGLAGTVIPVTEGSKLDQAIAGEQLMDRLYDLDLRLAVGHESAVPCVFEPVHVRQRPVLMLYLDRNGAPFSDSELEIVRHLCRVASNSLEEVVKLRHRSDVAAPQVTTSDAPASFQVEQPSPASAAASPSEHDAAPSLPRLVEPGPAEHRGPTLIAQKPLVPPTEQADAGRRNFTPVTLPISEFQSPPDRRAPTLPGNTEQPRDPEETNMEGFPIPPLVTVGASPPPPPVPPPPEPDSSDAAHPETLPGIPLEQRARAEVPPPAEDDDEVIPLTNAVSHGSSRGKIQIDHTDLEPSHPPSAPARDSSEQEADQAVSEVLEREGDSVSRLRRLGRPAMLRLAARFPGPLEVLRRDLNALPPPSAHGPLIRAAIGLGKDMTPYLIELFDHPDPDVRFYAAFVFQELRDARCVVSLSELAFDENADVRTIAMRVLETHARAPQFETAVEGIRSHLESTEVSQQQHAARAVGTLRDVESIPQLIDQLGHEDATLRDTALESLCSITGQQHGLKPHRWRNWYQTHGERHRIEWIIDSLRHKELPVRRWAYDELVRITGHRVPHSPAGDRKAQNACVEAWLNWWESEGRHRFEH